MDSKREEKSDSVQLPGNEGGSHRAQTDIEGVLDKRTKRNGTEQEVLEERMERAMEEIPAPPCKRGSTPPGDQTSKSRVLAEID